MALTYSFDSASLGKAKLTDEGFLRAPVKISRVGVANYGYAKKVKLPSELFSNLTLDSIRGLPIVDEHPQDKDGFLYVTPENYKSFAKGSVSEPKVEGDGISAIVTIWDKDLVKKVLSGKQEVSFGYSKEDDVQGGEFDGEQYSIVQRQIVGNHLAVTEKGRMGNNVKIELDSNFKKINKGNKMSTKYVIEEDGKLIDSETKTLRHSDGKDIQVDTAIYNEIMIYKNGEKASKVEVDSLKNKVVELEKKKPEIDSGIQAKVKSFEADALLKDATIKTLESKLKSQKAEFDSNLNDEVNQRIALESNAKSLKIEIDNKSSDEIKKEFISKSMDVDISTIEADSIDAFYKASIQLNKKIESGSVKTKNKNSINSDFDSSEKIMDARAKELLEINKKDK